MAGLGKDYVVGKGRLNFDQFIGDTFLGRGEMYFGNTPELTVSADTTTLDHFDADEGLNVKDESHTTERNMTGSFITDNISNANVALWFNGEATPTVISAATAVTETIKVRRGRTIQLGKTTTLPSGARAITLTSIKIGAITIAQATNYEVDAAMGRVYIEADSPDIDDDDDLIFLYDIAAATRTIVVAKDAEIRGALRFISNNPVGTQKDYFYPYVKITSNGDFALKGDDWMQLPFSFEVLKLGELDRVYIDPR